MDEHTMNTQTQPRAKAKISIQTMASVGVMTAVICILAPFKIVIPASPVPVTLGVFAILLALYILGMKWGLVSTLLYIALGFIGLPVFSGFTGGANVLFGPTGGYIIGYIFMALVTGFLLEHWWKNYIIATFSMIAGVLICYVFGTLWLSIQLHRTFAEALSIGVLPYIPADAVKIIIALIVGPELKKALIQAHILTEPHK